MNIRKILESLESLENIGPELDLGEIFLGNTLRRDRVEKKIYDAIYQYMRGPSYETKAKLSPILKQLLKFKNLYPNELKPNPDVNGYVYRGKKVNYDTYESLKNYNSNYNSYGNNWEPFVYHPQYEIQSWTNDYEVALDFSESGYTPIPVHDNLSQAEFEREYGGIEGIKQYINIPDETEWLDDNGYNEESWKSRGIAAYNNFVESQISDMYHDYLTMNEITNSLYSVILRTKPDDSFIFSTNFTLKITSLIENEILRVSLEPLKCEICVTHIE